MATSRSKGETPERRILDRLQVALQHKQRFDTKIRRLRAHIANVTFGEHLRESIDITDVNYLLVNLHLKVAALMAGIRDAQIRFRNAPDTLSYAFKDRVLLPALPDFEAALKDRFGVGVGVIGVGYEQGKGAFLMRVAPEDVYWSPTRLLHDPLYLFRRVHTEKGAIYWEYWDRESYALIRDDKVQQLQANPMRDIPFRILTNLTVPGIAFPISDTELCLPAQMLLRENRRALLKAARTGSGFYEYRRDAVDPLELEKLADGEEVFIATDTGNEIQVRVSPPLNIEWVNLEGLVKQDLDAQSGVSEYLRGSMPIANTIRFATQVLAALSAQNLRIQSDWLPIQSVLLDVARLWVQLAHINGERIQHGDEVIDMGNLPIQQIHAYLPELEQMDIMSILQNPLMAMQQQGA